MYDPVPRRQKWHCLHLSQITFCIHYDRSAYGYHVFSIQELQSVIRSNGCCRSKRTPAHTRKHPRSVTPAMFASITIKAITALLNVSPHWDSISLSVSALTHTQTQPHLRNGILIKIHQIRPPAFTAWAEHTSYTQLISTSHKSLIKTNLAPYFPPVRMNIKTTYIWTRVYVFVNMHNGSRSVCLRTRREVSPVVGNDRHGVISSG